MIVVSNTSPITNLAAVGQLQLLQQLYSKFWVSDRLTIGSCKQQENSDRVHLIFAYPSVGAKHSGIKMMAEDDQFWPRMLRPPPL